MTGLAELKDDYEDQQVNAALASERQVICMHRPEISDRSSSGAKETKGYRQSGEA